MELKTKLTNDEECHEAVRSIMECACWYRTARMAVAWKNFEKDQYVSVNWTRTVYNCVTGKFEDLFNVWIQSGDKYPSELFSRALKDFCL